MNGDFNKEALFEGARTNAPVIHISSHFWFNPAKEETSFLLLGNGGRLEMTEFQDYPNLFANVDLLSLSACDTATGSATIANRKNETNGKEVEGFAYVAQTLGAKSVIASLWQVSDQGTKELMTRFYKLRAANLQMSKGEAFRQAQLTLLGEQTSNKLQNSRVSRDLIEQGASQNDAKKIESPLFVKDAKRPFAHPYYWSSFVLIGNWR